MARSRQAGAFLISLTAALAIGVGGAWADGDAEKGAKVFKKKCKTCHTLEAGKNKLGPTLLGIVGRPAAQVEGYKYSKAMKESGVTWDEATLDAFLKKPKAMMKKTKMVFPGLKKDDDRADIIAHLKAAQ